MLERFGISKCKPRSIVLPVGILLSLINRPEMEEEKKKLKLKKIETLIYVRNIDRIFNKEGLIKHTVEINIYYQGYKERIEIDVIGD